MKLKPIALWLVSWLGCVAGNGLQGREMTAAAETSRAALRYEINVELDDAARMLIGREEIVWTNRTKDTVPDMFFHLYFNAFKNENSTVIQELKDDPSNWPLHLKEGDWGWMDVSRIELADGRDLSPTMEFMTRDEPVHAGDQTVMRIRFPEPVTPGGRVHLRLEFRAKIPRSGLRAGYYRHSYFIGQWFPKPGVYEEGKGWNCHEYHLNAEFFADFADFTVRITAPENFVVGASGNLIESTTDKSAAKTRYTFVQSMIHDFAWTASPEFIKIERPFVAADEVTPGEYEQTAAEFGLSPDKVKLPDVKMILLIQKAHLNQIERHFQALRTAIKFYGLWYGPYPYETVTMVDPPFRTGSGGMEYPTLFTAGTSVLKSRKDLSTESVIVHEFGHSYWYGLSANNEFEEAWLDEGINTYATGKVMALAYGRRELGFDFHGIPLSLLIDFPKFYDFESDRAEAIFSVIYDAVVTPSWKFFNSFSYGANVYKRASTGLHTLERLLGAEIMAKIMRAFQTRYRFKHPTTEDFIDVVNEVSRKNMTWFFEELFFNTLNFDYAVASLRSVEKPRFVRGVFDAAAGKKEEMTGNMISELEDKHNTSKRKIFVTTVILRRIGEARLRGEARLKVKVVFEDGSAEARFWDGRERWIRMTFEKNSRATQAQIDPETIWLIDSNLANNSFRLSADRKGLLRFAAKALFWLQNLCLSASSIS